MTWMNFRGTRVGVMQPRFNNSEMGGGSIKERVSRHFSICSWKFRSLEDAKRQKSESDQKQYLADSPIQQRRKLRRRGVNRHSRS